MGDTEKFFIYLYTPISDLLLDEILKGLNSFILLINMAKKKSYDKFYDEGYKKIYKKINYNDPLCDLGDLTRIRLVEKTINKIKINKSLDAGCGGGLFLPILSKYSSKVLGIDISEVALKFAKKRNKYLKLKNVRLKKLSLNKIRTLKERFDLIICMEVLEHCENDKEIINNLYNSLSKKGILIISVPNSSYLLISPSNIFEEEDVGHINNYNKKTIKKLLKERFKIKEIISYKTFFLPWIERLNKKLYFAMKNFKFYLNFLFPIFLNISKIDLFLFRKNEKSDGIFIVCKKS